MYLQHLQLRLLHLTNNVSWCCAAVRVDWYCAADLFWWSVSFLPIVVMKHWACLFLLFIQQPRGTACFLQGEEEREEETAGQTFSSRLIECAQFTCVWEMFAFFSSLCLCVRAKQTVTSDLINLSDQFLFLHVNIYLNMCRCVHVLVMTHTLAHTDAHTQNRGFSWDQQLTPGCQIFCQHSPRITIGLFGRH